MQVSRFELFRGLEFFWHLGFRVVRMSSAQGHKVWGGDGVFDAKSSCWHKSTGGSHSKMPYKQLTPTS